MAIAINATFSRSARSESRYERTSARSVRVCQPAIVPLLQLPVTGIMSRGESCLLTTPEWDPMLRTSGRCWIGVAAMCISVPAYADSPDFRRDVAPILSRAGCNAGACHGNQNGKGGFKLSLRGQDPDFDFAALTRDSLGRRTDPFHPDQSLILQKASGALSHEGGRRFDPDSLEYRTIRDWIAAGRPAGSTAAVTRLTVTPAMHVTVEPANTVKLRVEAAFADGTTRDVTRLAVLEPTSDGLVTVAADGAVRRDQFGETVIQVRYLTAQTAARIAFVPARPNFHWADRPERNVIDKLVFAKLRALRMSPAPLADDSTFLRRVSLDVLGVLPTPDETRNFLADTHPTSQRLPHRCTCWSGRSLPIFGP